MGDAYLAGDPDNEGMDTKILYHGTTAEAAAQIRRCGYIEPGDSRNEGQALVWLTSDPAYARLYGEELVEVPATHLPIDAVRSRIGPETYAMPCMVTLC